MYKYSIEGLAQLGINCRNPLILEVSNVREKSKNRELLNYQSNILFLLINKVYPSIY